MNFYSNNIEKEKIHIYFIMYMMVFSFTLFYIILNPEAGRDYHSYIRLIGEIKDNLYFREVGFYYSVQILSIIGITPENIILIFRVIFFFLILRFFYYTSQDYKIFGLVFFLFIPNIFIGSLNALQTWLAIAIFMQAFIDIDSRKFNVKLFWYSIIAFSFHYFSLFYILIFFNYKYASNTYKTIFLLLIIIMIPIVQIYVVEFLSIFGYLRYLGAEEISFKFLLITSVFIISYSIVMYIEDNERIKNIFFDFIIALILFVILVLVFKISNEIILRSLNFFLPFFWLSIVLFLKKQTKIVSFIISIVFIILLISNFFINTDFNSDMLNLKGFRKII